ncbi:glycoside hydrolase family 38 C-terminal domain-containing protein [Paenarthrobacter sp. PH39-S1]|uniref:alpha-mannosidase n=1 Tax=Paenarthrobacter sp. PH39-S1 TaxID=3046204 RepID=UPI0024BB3BE6|nr:glycoside hydrolase family 38 C-terminal domain-containing protein [Paenarthrobacter sp. PH39-S1]MDJ0354616.1 glycoside hydrolase family 38 C-terminal domain-containing protein [Paenarthrobacter sp. PH39-S1]
MHDDRLLTEARLNRFVADRLLPAVYARALPLTVTGWNVPDEPVSFAEAVDQDYVPVVGGEPWGAPWSTKWLRISGTVPAGWGGEGRTLEAVVDLGFTIEIPGFQCEGIAWRLDGTIAKAISPRNQHVSVDLLGSGDGIEFLVEAAANPDVARGFVFAPTPLGDKATAGALPQYRLGPIVLAERDLQVWELCQDVGSLNGLMHVLPVDLPRRSEILRALETMMDVMDPTDVSGTAVAGRAALAEVLSRPAYASAHNVVATGHAHIDSAWLWPVRETIRKCARTFANVLALMNDHPDFVFSCSSAQQLAWIKEFYPDLFVRIKAKVATGQFVPVGGMWVEADTNMPGGEAMARQFVEGKSFFRREFGVECRETWLPDSFGYSGALPQIARAAGMEWFLTQKISWNQVNRMPHHTFLWEGIDGSRIFTHFPPVDTYSSELSAAELAHAQRNYREHGRGTLSLVPFGYGDGGGGPTREMIAAAYRAADLEGSPTVSIGSPAQFFAQAAAEYPDPPVWLGEMYLELHRGTYTSQANTKLGNRRSEHLLREAELWAATAAVRLGMEYPAGQLKRLWQLVLLQQFHDILPGSSIAWVHRDAERNYDAIAGELYPLIRETVQALAGAGDEPLLVNAAPHERAGVPALGIGPMVLPDEPVRITEADGGYVLANGIIRAAVDANGLLTSLLDYATGREAIAPGSFGNHLELHRDTPNAWDAWDIDEFYRHNVTSCAAARSVTLERMGREPVVVIERLVGSSPVTQRIRLAAGSPSLSIQTLVDWQESEKLLKLGFPFDVRADRSAAETQFGHVYRPTHTNTSWEAAKFEICAHRWIHVAEPGYGVAVSNSNSYGHDVTRAVRSSDQGTTTTVRLSLLRAPRSPDPFTDQGPHGFWVTVRPGAAIADAVEEGYRTNLEALHVRGAAPVQPLFTVYNRALVIEAVKLAEDGSGDVVVRLYESLGQRSTGLVTAHFPVRSVEVTDLLEEAVAAPAGVVPGPGGAELTLRPFQLVTLRFRR